MDIPLKTELFDNGAIQLIEEFHKDATTQYRVETREGTRIKTAKFDTLFAATTYYDDLLKSSSFQEDINCIDDGIDLDRENI
jgi:hypothetical protein